MTDTAVMAPFTLPLDYTAIEQILPHRYPFLLVDRIVTCKPGEYVLGVKNVSCSEAGRAGDGGLPHLLVIEALAQLSVVLAYKTLHIAPNGTELMFFAGIDDARFGAVAYPGDRITLRCSVGRIKRLVGRFIGDAWVGNQQVVSVSMLAAIRSK